MKLFSTHHRDIGRMYLLLGGAAVIYGVLLSLVMRIHRTWPTWPLPGWGVIKPEDYLAAVTLHGTLMVFFVLVIVPQFGFGNFVLPEQIGAKEVAVPWLNAAALWTTIVAFAVLCYTPFVPQGAPISGWTSYPPFSALAQAGPGEGLGLDLWFVSIGLFCLAATMNGANQMATVLLCRRKDLRWMQLPLTVWAWWTGAVLSVIIFSTLLLAAILLFCDRHVGTAFFIPAGEVLNGIPLTHAGNGSPLLWLHLFWFFGHPVVYLAILPGMGLASEIFALFCRRKVPAYKWMVATTLLIGLLGLVVWGHHMFVAGLNPFAGELFQLTTIAIALPSTAKVLNWLSTLWGSRPRYDTPMLWCLGFLSLFIVGGMTGPLLAQPSLDSYLHNTFFVVAHFHLVMGMAVAFSIFAAVTYWFPLIAHRTLDEKLGKFHFWWTLFFAYNTFFPMHIVGLRGEPRHYAQLTGMPGPAQALLQSNLPLERHITLCALLLALGQLIFLWNIWRTLRSPRTLDLNPWNARTLEWERE